MKLSTSVAGIWHEYGLEEAAVCAALKRCGFDFADCDFDTANPAGWQTANAVEWGRSKAKSMKESGVQPAVAHILSKDPFAERDLILQALRCAGALGVDKIVIPLGTRPDNSRAEYEVQNVEYLKALLTAADEADVMLLLEHSGSWRAPHYTHGAMELMCMMEKLGNSSRLGISLNIAHLGIGELQPLPEIRLLGSSIKNVDAADNFGGMPLAVHPEREELGLAPMMGYIDYDRVMQGLREIRYDGVFNLRMNMPRVFDKTSSYCENIRLRVMPQELTERLTVWSRHICEHMLRTYGLLGGER